MNAKAMLGNSHVTGGLGLHLERRLHATLRCSAGELAELVSTDGGTTWSTASTNLSAPSCGGGLVRAGGQFVLRDLRGSVARAVSAAGTVTATAVFDALGVQRSGTGALASGVIRDTYGNGNEDGMTAFLNQRSLQMRSPEYTEKTCDVIHSGWIDKCDRAFQSCLALLGIPIGVGLACLAACLAPEPVLTKTACALCLILAGVGSGAAAMECYKRYKRCRDRADAWMIRCLRRAEAG